MTSYSQSNPLGAAIETVEIADGAVTNAKVNAAAAIAVSKLATGILEEIVDTTLGANATAINITGLDIGADSFYLLVYSYKYVHADSGTVSIFFNGDTTANNYWAQHLLNYNGNTVLGVEKNVPTLMESHSHTQNDLRSGFMIFTVNVDGEPQILHISGFDYTAVGSGTMSVGLECIQWVTQANLTQITLTASKADGLGTGSRIQMFKVSK